MIKKITEKRLENITLYYLQRYESCSSKVRMLLKRRVLKLKMQQIEIPTQIDCWIENIIEKMINLGYINDYRYIENTVRRLQNSGKSIRYILNKLKQDGIEANIIQSFFEETIQNSEENDLLSAKHLVKKRKLGRFRESEKRIQMYQKDMAILGRAGFSYEIAKKALQKEED